MGGGVNGGRLLLAGGGAAVPGFGFWGAAGAAGLRVIGGLDGVGTAGRDNAGTEVELAGVAVTGV